MSPPAKVGPEPVFLAAERAPGYSASFSNCIVWNIPVVFLSGVSAYSIALTAG